MKKYFFLISLFGFLLLGLGNYSFGQFSSCGTEPAITASQSDKDSYNACIQSQSSSDTFSDLGSSSSCSPGDPGCSENKFPCGDGRCDEATQKCVDPATQKCACDSTKTCCGIKLNTNVPFIGNCIEDSQSSVGGNSTNVTSETAFPVLMSSLTKILVTAILIISFVLIVIGGIMISTGNPSGGKKMIINVVVGIALLGASGVILRLINPNFFG